MNIDKMNQYRESMKNVPWQQVIILICFWGIYIGGMLILMQKSDQPPADEMLMTTYNVSPARVIEKHVQGMENVVLGNVTYTMSDFILSDNIFKKCEMAVHRNVEDGRIVKDLTCPLNTMMMVNPKTSQKIQIKYNLNEMVDYLTYLRDIESKSSSVIMAGSVRYIIKDISLQ